ncbi:hypothetical protein [Komagataeibacter europaeus]|uniref:hypothetical protein n=1 Tax=Komagataeibacter europaeus TaxID=33995 RepID=UPI000237DD36|nr:hypothetical protein [Komagataeibacter europaeus]
MLRIAVESHGQKKNEQRMFQELLRMMGEASNIILRLLQQKLAALLFISCRPREQIRVLFWGMLSLD